MATESIDPRKELQAANASFANFLADEIKIGDRLWIALFVHMDPPHEIVSSTLKRMFKIRVFTDYYDELIFHWGVGRKFPAEWTLPDERLWPERTRVFDIQKSVQTFFTPDKVEIGFKSIILEIQADEMKICGLNYVIFEPSSKIWYNNNSADYHINFSYNPIKIEKALMKSSSVTMASHIKSIIECEVEYGSWTLMHRFNKCAEILNKIEIKEEAEVAWLFVWLRYSSIRQLDWQRRYNTKPRDLTGAQNNLLGNILEKMFLLRSEAKSGSGKKKPLKRKFMGSLDLLRQMLSFIGKGGINGQEIRDEILNILHRNHIKETNDHFYEQWHQKLHNNTTPDDIVICEAVLEYLRKNDISVYWATLKKGGVTKERLLSFERKVVAEPFFAPHLIPDLENFLKILKKAHSSTDLITMAETAIPRLSSHLQSKIKEILSKIADSNIISQLGEITSFRGGLLNEYQNTSDLNAYKEMVFLDIALEFYVRQLVEKVIHIDIGAVKFFQEIELLIENLSLSFDWQELEICRNELKAVMGDISMCNKNYFSALKVKAVVERVKRCLGEVVDRCLELLQPKAVELGTACHCDKFFIDIFSEDVIRGSLFFALSMVIKKVEPILRKTLGVQNWLIISPITTTKGKVVFVKQLRNVQISEEFKEPTIMITEAVGGDEEVPTNVKGVILINNSDYPDILAHVSVRARNGKVLLAACLDDSGATAKKLMEYIGLYIKLNLIGANIEIQPLSKEDVKEKTTSAEPTAKKVAPKAVASKEEIKEYMVTAKDFGPLVVGAKSNNLNKIRGKVESWILLPEGIALQFNSAEDIISDSNNIDIKEKLEKIREQMKECSPADIPKLLEQSRAEIMKLKLPPTPKGKGLQEALMKFGIPETDIAHKAWIAMKRVLASKYNERAYIATKKVGISIDDIRMAVLVQKIIPAEYAFVIHTKNPINNSVDEIYAEVVRGLGETLVGRYAGQALSFVVNKKTLEPKILSIFNKSVGIRTAGGYMFRSDSNTEDLEGFAGAGLFDSFPSEGSETFDIQYGTDQILVDASFRDFFMKQIAKIGLCIEKIYEGMPQDIEGCFAQKAFYVVQTRPQV